MTAMKKHSLTQSMQEVLRVCEKRGFKVRHIYADLQFECIEDEIDGVEVDIVDADDHVEVVERAIRTIKENIRSLMHETPYRRIPRLMVKRLVEVATRNLNSFPADGGISDECSPLSIVTGAHHQMHGHTQSILVLTPKSSKTTAGFRTQIKLDLPRQ